MCFSASIPLSNRETGLLIINLFWERITQQYQKPFKVWKTNFLDIETEEKKVERRHFPLPVPLSDSFERELLNNI